VRRKLGAIVALLLAATARIAAAEWRQAETEHFLIVFERQDQASADELAAICEDVYARVTGFFRSYPRKVPVVVRGRLDYANGLTAPFPGRLELIVTAPSWPDLSGARSESWMRMVLTHELTHYVHLGMERGLFHALARVFGADARWAASVFLPGWMIEGPTTNLETLFTSGGRGRNPFFEASYKAPTMEGRLFSLAQAGYSSAFPPSGRIYVAGYVLVDYLLRTFGEDAFTRIMGEYLRFPFFGPWRAIRTVTGKSARDIYDAMRAALEERYRGAAGVPGGTRISPDRIGDWQHPVPTERGLFAYRSDLDGFPAIVRLDPAGASERVIAPLRLTDPSSFTATADGRTLCAASFFADRRRTDGEEVVSDLSSIDALTGSMRRITTGAHLWHPALSADGSRLVAVQGSGPYTRLVEVDPQSGRTRVLFAIAGASVFNPAVSPDGNRIALVVNRGGIQDVAVIGSAEALAGSREIVDPHAPVEDVNASLVRWVVGSDPNGEYFPTWNGNDRLLFSSDRSGSLVLYEADLAAGSASVVQADPVSAYEGVVTGDGDLVYASYSADGYCLKQAPFAPARDQAAAVTLAPADVPAAIAPPPAAASIPYADRARPYLWYPLVTLGSAASSLEDFVAAIASGDRSVWDFGVGAQVLAGSYVGTSSWSLGAAWHPLTSQPEISFSLARGYGNATVEAWTLTGYHAFPGACFLESDAGLGVSVPLIAASSYDRQTALTVRAGATFVSQAFNTVDRSSPFSLVDVFTDPDVAWAHAILLDGGAGFIWGKGGGARDLVTPRLARLSATGEVMLPALDGTTGARFQLLAQAGMPVIWEHLVVRAGLKTAYGIGSLNLAGESFAAARGFGVEARPLPGRMLASLDLLAPIGLFDLPLVPELALLGMSAGLHAEAVADWELAPSSFEVPWVCAGAETVFLLDVFGLQIPIGLGVSARFDPTGDRAFDVTDDLRGYVFLSFDGFLDAAKAARPAPRHVLD